MKEKENSFFIKARKIHEDKYDYSLVAYKNAKTKIKIICLEHGIFEQTPNAHLQGQGCPTCAQNQNKNRLRKTKEEFIKESKKIHKDKYDYSLVEYKNNKTKIKIICLEHGIFEQTPDVHLRGAGCPKCGILKRQEQRLRSVDDFINKANEIHNNCYTYSKSEYKNSKAKIKIICPEHGEFWQTPNMHLLGQGCPKCTKTGFNPNKKAILYYLKDIESNTYKIGITNKTVEERFRKFQKKIQVIQTWQYDNGELAYLAEQEILQAFAFWRYTNTNFLKNGGTEFFKWDILELDKGN